jgi:uncharacterized protein (DUF302 family)
MTASAIGMTRQIPGLDYDQAVERAKKALQEEGFGVLTEIDVQATLKEKIDVDFRPYLIIGACNPHLSHRVLETSPEFGMLMPCNVVVETEDDGVRVSMADPAAMAAMSERSTGIQPIVAEARQKLRRALDAI